jgi:hypothetical protein
VFATGTAVTSAGIRSDTSVMTRSGTSMAAAYVTGAAALYLGEEPFASPKQVREAVVRRTAANTVADPGRGSPNRMLRTETSAPPVPPPDRDPVPPPSPEAEPSPPEPSPSAPSPGLEPPEPGPSLEPLPGEPPAGEPTDPRPGEPAPGPAACGTFSQEQQLVLPEKRRVTSPILVAACGGRASTASQVRVHADHPRAGDLAIGLISPDGTVYPLRSPDPASAAGSLTMLVSLDLSAAARDGTWRLAVTDTAAGNAGCVVSWHLRI